MYTVKYNAEKSARCWLLYTDSAGYIHTISNRLERKMNKLLAISKCARAAKLWYR